VKEVTYLEQKVRIIAFLEMVFECGKDERSIPFAAIAEKCKVEPSDVELLVMKAMSLDLIRGSINEVDSIVHVDWCQPRYLNKGHIELMVEKMKKWEQHLDGAIRLCEANGSELIAS
jgi:26S proteasome regulatory subunit N9